MVLRLLGFVGGIVLVGGAVLMFLNGDQETFRGKGLVVIVLFFAIGALLLLKAGLHQRGQDKRNLEAFKKIPYADDKEDVS